MELEKVQENLHIVMHKVYQRALGEEQVEDVPMTKKVKKVDDKITELQT